MLLDELKNSQAAELDRIINKSDSLQKQNGL
jgi:hypothetical protein